MYSSASWEQNVWNTAAHTAKAHKKQQLHYITRQPPLSVFFSVELDFVEIWPTEVSILNRVPLNVFNKHRKLSDHGWKSST